MHIYRWKFSERCICWCTECDIRIYIRVETACCILAWPIYIECFALLKTDLCRPEFRHSIFSYCPSITHRRRIQCGHCVDRNFDSLHRSTTRVALVVCHDVCMESRFWCIAIFGRNVRVATFMKSHSPRTRCLLQPNHVLARVKLFSFSL